LTVGETGLRFGLFHLFRHDAVLVPIGGTTFDCAAGRCGREAERAAEGFSKERAIFFAEGNTMAGHQKDITADLASGERAATGRAGLGI